MEKESPFLSLIGLFHCTVSYSAAPSHNPLILCSQCCCNLKAQEPDHVGYLSISKHHLWLTLAAFTLKSLMPNSDFFVCISYIFCCIWPISDNCLHGLVLKQLSCAKEGLVYETEVKNNNNTAMDAKETENKYTGYCFLKHFNRPALT